MSLKGQMHNYRMKYTENGLSLTLYIYIYTYIWKIQPFEKNESKRSDAQLQNEVYRKWAQSDPSEVMDL